LIRPRVKESHSQAFMQWIRAKDICILALSSEHEYDMFLWGDAGEFMTIASMKSRRDAFADWNASISLDVNKQPKALDFKKVVENFRRQYYLHTVDYPIFESSAKIKHIFKEVRQTFGTVWFYWMHHSEKSQEKANANDILQHLIVWSGFMRSMMSELEKCVTEENYRDWIAYQKHIDWPHTNSLVRFIELSNVIFFAKNIIANGSSVSIGDITLKPLYDLIMYMFPKTRERMLSLDGYDVSKSMATQREQVYLLNSNLESPFIENSQDRLDVMRKYLDSISIGKRTLNFSDSDNSHQSKRSKTIDTDLRSLPASEEISDVPYFNDIPYDSLNCIDRNAVDDYNYQTSAEACTDSRAQWHPDLYNPLPSTPQIPASIYDSIAYTPFDSMVNTPTNQIFSASQSKFI
jgi:hypothetical protein